MLLRHTLFFSTGGLLVLGLARCSGGTSQNPPGATAIVGPTGGTVTSADGSLHMSVPANALPANVTITVTTTKAPGPGSLGTVYEIGPTGTKFNTPVTMTFDYAGLSLGGKSASDLRVATFASGAWQPLAGFSEDTNVKTVSGLTTHLSPYALIAQTGASTCATVPFYTGCGSSSGSSSGSLGGSGSSSGAGSSTSGSSSSGASSSTGSGGSTSGSSSGVVCGGATCATADTSGACASYPGASAQSCLDDSSGYQVSCCFAPGAPACFAVAGYYTCSGSSGGSSGSGSTSSGSSTSGSSSGAGSGSSSGSASGSGSGGCTGAPTCAASSATACGAYPGASVSGCTDSASGYTASCCFPTGKPVCIATSVASSCASGSSSGSSGGSGSGSGSGGCTTNVATCANGNPCGGYAGATVQSCTDTASGFDATCCFPVGVMPPDGAVNGTTVSGGGFGGGPVGGSSGGSSGGTGFDAGSTQADGG